MRIAVEFEKKGPAKYISHLDLQRAFSRAVRRAELPVRLSKGFNPHYIISFASALALGVESECECVEMETDDIPVEKFLLTLAKALPPGLLAVRAAMLKEGSPKLASAVRTAQYNIFFKDADQDKLKSAVCDIISSDRIIILKTKDGKTTELDIRPKILALEVCGECVSMKLEAGPSGALKPDAVAQEIKKRADGFPCRIVRTGLFAAVAGREMGLIEAFGRI